MKKQILLVGGLVAIVVIGIISYNLFKTPEAASSQLTTPAAVISDTASSANGTVYIIDTANSEARFVIEEVLRNVDTTVIGTTNQISGQIVFDTADVQTAVISQITINARTLATDNSMRNRAISNQVLLTNQHEYISFTPTELVGLPQSVQIGQSYTFQIIGDLTIIGQTQEVIFTAEVTPISATELSGLATTTLSYEDFGITIPFSSSVQAVADEVTLELEFTAKAG